MNAVSILSDTEIAVERVQKFANSSAAIRMENNRNSTDIPVSGNTDNASTPSDSDNMMQNMSQEIENLKSKFDDLQEIINKLDNSEYRQLMKHIILYITPIPKMRQKRSEQTAMMPTHFYNPRSQVLI